MTQKERRIYLLQQLIRERGEEKSIGIPMEEKGQKDLLRALMNIRPPKPVAPEFLAVQDEYLTAERERVGIVDGSALSGCRLDERLALWQGDITMLAADAIVNAANSALLGCFYPLHGCIDNQIHSKSGIQLRLYCNELMKKQGHEEPVGRAKLTPAYNLPCRYILHTVGPIIRGWVQKEDRDQLASCYRSCLKLAAENGLRSLAFCCISTGEFRFPNEEAAEIAVKTVREFLRTNQQIQRVVFNVFKEMDLQIYRKMLGEDGC